MAIAGKIWLIGGTQESARLARQLAQAGLPCIVSVTTEAARSLYPETPEIEVWVTRFDAPTLASFLDTQDIRGILDASHPFATEISQQAIAAASAQDVPYLRYERPDLSLENLSPGVQTVPSFEALLQQGTLVGQRVLLIVGYRPLGLFRGLQAQATLFARLLPSIPALEAALAAGFSPDRLMALRPPVSEDLERSLWQHWGITHVVTKASGQAGGEDIKRRVAADLGIPLTLVQRPRLDYLAQTEDLQRAIAFCQACLQKA
ncbi:cobalt-precorrin-6A reductase [Geitlerinema sp. PCC 7407]|uniref:cobalt-precorrin-6A reductase n=1 Tax=Geitlerinema sp. PCC 7407 TaxID=1173025 RepID=UPI00029FD680|nr:cobalt-precorrin-6A reductase [Geitlerinema sp. PCC 7407]AFY65088.1 precorrin-6x reductase [Geitlerinema sp. PCC 7407]